MDTIQTLSEAMELDLFLEGNTGIMLVTFWKGILSRKRIYERKMLHKNEHDWLEVMSH